MVRLIELKGVCGCSMSFAHFLTSGGCVIAGLGRPARLAFIVLPRRPAIRLVVAHRSSVWQYFLIKQSSCLLGRVVGHISVFEFVVHTHCFVAQPVQNTGQSLALTSDTSFAHRPSNNSVAIVAACICCRVYAVV